MPYLIPITRPWAIIRGKFKILNTNSHFPVQVRMLQVKVRAFYSLHFTKMDIFKVTEIGRTPSL